ncbi:MAG: hypothetical protein L0H23_10650, partial [Luteimonas sp.]|nr:hypothetical protein [Luteimonas sp.]
SPARTSSPTASTVTRLPSGTIVAVSEGKVRMIARSDESLGAGIKAWLDGSRADEDRFNAKDATSRPLREQASLEAGHAVRITSSGRMVAPVQYADSLVAASATPRLTFHDDTLADIVTEFNRYNARQIVVDDDDIRWQRYSGVFNANDADSFLQFLECCSSVTVARDDEQTRLGAPRGGTTSRQ